MSSSSGSNGPMVMISSASQVMNDDDRFLCAMEKSYRELLTFEKKTAAASNTKKEIKASVERLGKELRRVINYCKTSGRIRPECKGVASQTDSLASSGTGDWENGKKPYYTSGILDRIASQEARLVIQDQKLDMIIGKLQLKNTGSQVVENAAEADALSSNGWNEVVKRKGKTKSTTFPKTSGPEVKPMLSTPPPVVLKPNVRSRPPAIMVDVSREEYPALAKKIRGGTNRDVLG